MLAELVGAGIRAKGGSLDVAQRYPEVCAAAGLRVVSQASAVTLARHPRKQPGQ